MSKQKGLIKSQQRQNEQRLIYPTVANENQGVLLNICEVNLGEIKERPQDKMKIKQPRSVQKTKRFQFKANNKVPAL